MENYGLNPKQIQAVRERINDAIVEAKTYKNPANQGRLCVIKIPDTEWKVAILVP